MGVDMYYCEGCKECLHSDCFRQCGCCFDRLEYCDNCDGDDCIVKKKDINLEKYKEDAGNDDLEFDTITLNGKKVKDVIVLCDDCQKKYITNKKLLKKIEDESKKREILKAEEGFDDFVKCYGTKSVEKFNEMYKNLED